MTLPESWVFQSDPPQKDDLVSLAGLRVPLKPHQVNGVQWLINREGRIANWGDLLGRRYNAVITTKIHVDPHGDERQGLRGGFLADDMGLGKTLEFIALTMVSRMIDNYFYLKTKPVTNPRPGSSEWTNALLGRSGQPPGPTLVVAPKGLLPQWKEEILKFTILKDEDILIFHPSHIQGGSASMRHITKKTLQSKVFVLTNYEYATRKCFPDGVKKDAKRDNALFQMRWDRVGMDEGHVARNPKAGSFRTIEAIDALRRWQITGTPYQNSDKDLASLSELVLVPHPFQSKATKATIAKPASRDAERKWRRDCMLRRTKEELKESGLLPDFPDKHIHIVTYEMTDEETKTYITMESKWEILYQAWKRATSEEKRQAYMEILVHLLRMRQVLNDPDLCFSRSLTLPFSRERAFLQLSEQLHMCCNCRNDPPPPLTEEEGELEEFDEEASWMSDMKEKNKMSTEKPVDKLASLSNPKKLQIPFECTHRMCIGCFAKSKAPTDGPCSMCLSHPHSSRTEAILRILRSIPKGEKTVVFSQWTSYLDLLEKALIDANITYVRMDGDVPDPAERQRVKLHFVNSNVRVFLGSTKAGGLGLNLVAANHLILADKFYNPFVDRQANDRVYRIGQVRNVHVYQLKPHLKPTPQETASNPIPQDVACDVKECKVCSSHVPPGPIPDIDVWLNRLRVRKACRGDQILDNIELSTQTQEWQKQQEDLARHGVTGRGKGTRGTTMGADEIEIANQIFGSARRRHEIAAKQNLIHTSKVPTTTTTTTAMTDDEPPPLERTHETYSSLSNPRQLDNLHELNLDKMDIYNIVPARVNDEDEEERNFQRALRLSMMDAKPVVPKESNPKQPESKLPLALPVAPDRKPRPTSPFVSLDPKPSPVPKQKFALPVDPVALDPIPQRPVALDPPQRPVALDPPQRPTSSLLDSTQQKPAAQSVPKQVIKIEDPDSVTEPQRKRKHVAEDDEPKRKHVAEDDEPKRKHVAEDDEPKRKVSSFALPVTKPVSSDGKKTSRPKSPPLQHNPNDKISQPESPPPPPLRTSFVPMQEEIPFTRRSLGFSLSGQPRSTDDPLARRSAILSPAVAAVREVVEPLSLEEMRNRRNAYFANKVALSPA